MKIDYKVLRINLDKDFGHYDITSEVKRFVADAGIKNGLVVVAVKGSTGAITTIEYEPNLLKDYEELMERIAPKNKSYHHTLTWGDHNGFSHLRSSLQKTSLTIPVVSGKLFLGTWQQIMVINFDEVPREREVLIQVIGE